jgi:hypothetical protein
MLINSLAGQQSVGSVMSVVTNYAYIYKEATFQSEKYDFKIMINEEVILIDDTLQNDFYNIMYKNDDITCEGYIYKECLAVLENEQKLILTYNAKTGVKTAVYSLSDPTQKIAEINEGTELYLYEGYHRKSDLTAVKFSYNGEIILGYIKTIDITPYGVSNVLIISVSAIVASVGVIFLLLGISKKKTKKIPLFKKRS